MAFALACCGGKDKTTKEADKNPEDSINCGEDLFNYYEGILNQMDPMAAEITAAYKEKTGYDYEVSYSDFALACVDVYSFSEGASIDFVKGVLDSFYEELVLKETGKNEYTLTYTGTDPYTEEKYKGKEIIKFDTDDLRMSCIQYRNDEYYSFAELARVGTDTYAGITPVNRVLIKCDGDTVKEFWYVTNIAEFNNEDGTYSEYSYLNDLDDAIYGRFGLDSDWVSEDDIGIGIFRLSHCYGTTLDVTGQMLQEDTDTGESYYIPGYKWSFTK